MPQGPPVVWVIAADQWTRALIRAELIERGCDAVGFEGLSRAVRSLGLLFIQIPECIVADLKGLDETGGELETLSQTGIPAIVLGGAVELDSSEEVRTLQWAAVVRRPFSIGDLAEKVMQLIQRLRKPASEPSSQ